MLKVCVRFIRRLWRALPTSDNLPASELDFRRLPVVGPGVGAVDE